MTLGTQDIELIKREVAGIRDFYQSRLDAELPPLQEEVGRIAAQLGRVQEQWRDGERRSILAKYGGDERPRATHGKYKGMDALSLAYVRSVLNAQLREPAGLNQRMLEDWQNNLKAALDSTTAGSGDELVATAEASALWSDVNLETLIAPLFSRVDMPTNPFEIPCSWAGLPGTRAPRTPPSPIPPRPLPARRSPPRNWWPRSPGP